MARTVVYDSPVTQAVIDEELDESARNQRKPTGPTAATRRAARSRAADPTQEELTEAAALPVKDDYAAKLAKYVPGEVVAVSLAGFAAFDPTGNWIWVGLGIGLFANLVYLVSLAAKLAVATRPRPYFYVLSLLAFVFWAVATIPQVRDQFGLEGAENADKAAYLLLFAAFIIPALDTAINGWELRPRQTSS